VANAVVAEPARQDLADLIHSHSLPTSTRDRVRRSIEPLGTLPPLGPALAGRWDGFRPILGPRPWMLVTHVYDEGADLVIVVTTQDARSGRSPRGSALTHHAPRPASNGSSASRPEDSLDHRSAAVSQFGGSGGRRDELDCREVGPIA
jgi:hypothetical protein